MPTTTTTSSHTPILRLSSRELPHLDRLLLQQWPGADLRPIPSMSPALVADRDEVRGALEVRHQVDVVLEKALPDYGDAKPGAGCRNALVRDHLGQPALGEPRE